ncbi:hypothetical protein [Agaribacterium sp. ZY112]|uniref:hypothetical protein n=1 Tax=Agaribacterium sp. ZY112 TaxID=3233574 RepID=UPI0035236D13
MSDQSIVLICIALAIFALFFVSLINHRQMRHKLIHQRLVKLRKKVAELEELSVEVETLTGSRVITGILIDHIIDLLDGMLELAPSSQSLEITRENALARRDELHNSEFQVQLNRIRESDAQIARAQFALNEAGVIIRKRQAAGRLELSQMNQLIEELAWAKMMAAVVSLVVQGHKSMGGTDVLRGFSFYKKATQCAMEANSTDERRHKLIKELAELANNKRKALSLDLMPEAQFNPKESSEA